MRLDEQAAMGMRNVSSYDDVLMEKCRHLIHKALARVNEEDELAHVDKLWPKAQRDSWHVRQRQQQPRRQSSSRRSHPLDFMAGMGDDALHGENGQGRVGTGNSSSSSSGSGSSSSSSDSDETAAAAAQEHSEAFRRRFAYTFEHFVEHLDTDSPLVLNLAQLLVGETARRAIAAAMVSSTQDATPTFASLADEGAPSQIAANINSVSDAVFPRSEDLRTRVLQSEIERITRRTRRSAASSARTLHHAEGASSSGSSRTVTPPRTRTIYSSFVEQQPSSEILAAAPAVSALTNPELSNPAATSRHARVGVRSGPNGTFGGRLTSSPSANELSRSDLTSLRRRLERQRDEFSTMRHARSNVSRPAVDGSLGDGGSPRDPSAVSLVHTSTDSPQNDTPSSSSLVRRFLLQPFPSDVRGGSSSASDFAREAAEDLNGDVGSVLNRHIHAQTLAANTDATQQGDLSSASTNAASEQEISLTLAEERRQREFIEHARLRRRQLRQSTPALPGPHTEDGSIDQVNGAAATTAAAPATASSLSTGMNAQADDEHAEETLRRAQATNTQADETLQNIMSSIDGADTISAPRNGLPLARLPIRARFAPSSPSRHHELMYESEGGR